MNHLEPNNSHQAEDQLLLPRAVAAVQAAGQALRARFTGTALVRSRQQIIDTIAVNDQLSMALLRRELSAAARWDDEGGAGPLPPGEWWVCDPVEGAINHVHGLPEWGVTATLVRDNRPVLTIVHAPMTADTYTAVEGGGAHLNGARLSVSAKSDLRAALAGTAQATPDEGRAIHRRMSGSIGAMLEAALVVRLSVPSTMQLVSVAAGRQDLFWQYSQVRSGLMAGALLVAEAGGSVTDLHGEPWHPGSAGLLASAPGLTAAAIAALCAVA